jgi:hypothetical protein
MFDQQSPPPVTPAASSARPASDASAAPGPQPTENLDALETEICHLAGHLAAATCQFLVLLGEFDAREGWASWDMPSCAAWLSWKCQMSSGTAREHVRVARAIRSLPVIRGEFSAGRLSYAKARALTRIATEETETDLVELATPMTANQLERFARAHRTVTRADEEHARLRRRLTFRTEDDGSLTLSAHLPPQDGAALLTALRAVLADAPPAAPDPAAPDDVQPAGVSAQTPAVGRPPSAGPSRMRPTSASLADALVEIAEAYLASQSRAASNPDVYQVIVHATPDALVPDALVPDVTPTPGDQRCHIEDGPAISKATLQQIACDAVFRWMTHDGDGLPLNVGRRRREPTPAQRLAVRERDKCHCRFPGCHRQAAQVHHIRWWGYGGPTNLDNLISLCRYHHGLIHHNGYQIGTPAPGVFTFYRPDGKQIPDSPPLPEPTGQLWDVHDAEITPQTIVPPWYGERLDLDHAIWVLFANQQVRQAREQSTLAA